MDKATVTGTVKSALVLVPGDVTKDEERLTVHRGAAEMPHLAHNAQSEHFLTNSDN